MMEKMRPHLFFWSCVGMITGIFLIDFVRILPSISMILIVLLGISYWVKPVLLSQNKHSSPFWLLTGTFFILLPSWFYSDNMGYLFEKWQIALPYLVLPIAFIKIPKLSDRRLFILYGLYFALTLMVSMIAFVYYLFHQESINQLYLESRVMPTILSHHPTLSLMMVFAVYIGYWMYQSKRFYKFKIERNLMAIGTVFLFIFIHIFSVRSGLLALYLVVLLELSRWIFEKKQYKNALLAGISLLVIGGTTLFVSPTVSNKIANTTQDLNNYQSKGSANNQSLSSRIISYKNAIRIAQESTIWMGCGLGDIKDLNEAIFAKDYPDVTKRIIPHNQFLFYFAAIGLIGVLAFCFFFYTPLWKNQAYKNPLLLVHIVIISVGFMFESPLQSQVGVAYSLVFYLLPLHKEQGASSLKSF
jgi:O-antigen ligase